MTQVIELKPAKSDRSATLGAQPTLVDQLVQWALHRMQEQVFRPGMRMPSVRQLAAERGVSRFTVVEAYERLVARGHLQARPGSGFFVREDRGALPYSAARRAATPVAQDAPPQTIDLSWLMRNMQSGIDAERAPGFGYLPPELCGGDLLKAGLRSVAALPSGQFTHAALALGYAPLREQLTRKLAETDIAARSGQVLTTSGATQAIDLVARCFLRPGDNVIVGDPAWSAQLGSLAMMGVNLLCMPYTPSGPDVEALAVLAANSQPKPKMLIINSVLHNPTSTLLTAASAYQILRIAEAHDMLIVEDDIYSDFLPSGVPATRLASLDQLKRVIYMGSFSKMLVPGIRVGFVAASFDRIQTLSNHKLLTSLATPEINERIVYRALTEGSYRKHCQRVQGALDKLREPCFKRMESLGLRAFCQPQAGFLSWFDAGVDTVTLAALALEAGYLMAPGALFSPTQTPSTWIRMNIASSHNSEMLKWLERTLEQLRARAA